MLIETTQYCELGQLYVIEALKRRFVKLKSEGFLKQIAIVIKAKNNILENIVLYFKIKPFLPIYIISMSILLEYYFILFSFSFLFHIQSIFISHVTT